MSDKGKLFVVATPIGNLQDFTFRAVETLKNVHCVFAEDTRTSKKLINHYDIDTKLYSYHDHSSDKEIARVLDILNDNKDVALISDAGTPTISDPGYSLIRKCISEGIDIVPIPGASALTTAVSASGLPSDAFTFIGFLPTKKGRQKQRKNNIKKEITKQEIKKEGMKEIRKERNKTNKTKTLRKLTKKKEIQTN